MFAMCCSVADSKSLFGGIDMRGRASNNSPFYAIEKRKWRAREENLPPCWLETSMILPPYWLERQVECTTICTTVAPDWLPPTPRNNGWGGLYYAWSHQGSQTTQYNRAVHNLIYIIYITYYMNGWPRIGWCQRVCNCRFGGGLSLRFVMSKNSLPYKLKPKIINERVGDGV